jgi:hypothetical protein
MMTRVVLPQVLPKLITAMRLGLVPAWIFLISAEAIASTSGLGYRIFLVRRFLAMDVILPYVAVDHAACLSDRPAAADLLSRRAFPWNHMQGKACERPTAKFAVHGVGKSYDGAVRARKRIARCRGRLVLHRRWRVGLRQIHLPAHAVVAGNPTHGVILLDGTPIPAEPTEDRGIVFQRYSVFPHLSVEDNLILADEFANATGLAASSARSRRAMRSTIDRTLEAIGLAGSRKSYPAQLSGGMQQRLAIAQALLKKPDVAPDGRTLRRARSGHPPRHACLAARSSGASAA